MPGPQGVSQALDLQKRGGVPVVAISKGRVTIGGQADQLELSVASMISKLHSQAEAWSNDFKSFRASQLLPLRLVGKPCAWRLEQSGLVLTPEGSEGAWQGHSLCMRLLTREAVDQCPQTWQEQAIRARNWPFKGCNRPWNLPMSMKQMARWHEEVEFQIVSSKLGFNWRVFPEGTSRRPSTSGPEKGLLGTVGGKAGTWGPKARRRMTFGGFSRF